MDIGLLLTLNFLSIPFIYEAETLGKESNEIPSFVSILKLKNTVKTRWIKLYAIFVFIFIAIALSPTESGKTYRAGWGLIGLILLIQLILWGIVIQRIRNSIKREN